jgi:hypothetical protein
MKQLNILTAIFLMGLQGGLMAQRESNRRDYNTGFQITGQVQLALPQNEFAEAFNGYPGGVGASLMIPLGRLKFFHVGAEYAWNSMGKKKSTVELYDDAQNLYLGDIEVGSDVRSYHFTTRFSPLKGSVRPYLDAFMGWRTYSTDSEIMVDDNDGSVTTIAYSLNRDASMSYGYSGGLMIALGRAIFLDGKVQVIRGGNVSYIDQSSLMIDTEGHIDYSLEISPTDMIVPQIGISIVF